MNKLLFGVIFVFVLISGFYYIQHQNEVIDNLEKTVDMQEQLIVVQKVASDALDTINIERRDFENKLDEALKKNYKQLQKLLQDDQVANTWANTLVPPSIIQLHKGFTASDLSYPSTKGKAQ